MSSDPPASDAFSPLLVQPGQERFSAQLIPQSNSPAPAAPVPLQSPAAGASPTDGPSGRPAPAPVPSEPMLPLSELKAQVAAAEARGHAAATADAQQQLNKMAAEVELARQMVAALDQAVIEQAQEARALVGALVIDSVRRIVGEHEVFQEQALIQAFGSAAASMVGEREVIVRVSPAQVAAAEPLVVDRPGWVVRPDPSIQAGVRLETERGQLDATLETALSALQTAVQSWRGEGE